MRKLLVLSLFFLLVSCGGKNVETTPPDVGLDEPDRVLFERATTIWNVTNCPLPGLRFRL